MKSAISGLIPMQIILEWIWLGKCQLSGSEWHVAALFRVVDAPFDSTKNDGLACWRGGNQIPCLDSTRRDSNRKPI